MAYFDYEVRGTRLDLAHLEPRTLTLFVRTIARELTIDVRFSNHCFTVAFDDNSHDRADLIWDYRRPRAYDTERHVFSRHLPTMVEALPSASVHLTPSDWNYVYLAHVTLPDGRAYPMYFGLRRAPTDHRQQPLMVMESAYPVADRKRVLAGTTKISFPVLYAKIYRGQTVRPRARR
ncbi:MAG: hypothetical protein WAP03_23140 [Methylorubrum rhodinum]|uniref:hypothetical protein n=1 Tax=Methylorubrum rhodinum TaxID=29428 RepID=UPI003BAEA050